ncbi:high mobility group nucleosome-binding domain-containing protein 5-like [Chrysoperla carnea]|uniref:high mobility group nucleosome-binding domain-containing protein 5-like n=1 Tax=Chrysoperla carnea TaxID=189513 RepID=UPI001D0972FD|nr:high mobility group nucleosome-binding domain-containing protein 5-like [Chrysoperla carnea]
MKINKDESIENQKCNSEILQTKENNSMELQTAIEHQSSLVIKNVEIGIDQNSHIEVLKKYDQDIVETLEKFDKDNADTLEKFDEGNVKTLERFYEDNAETFEKPVKNEEFVEPFAAEILQKYDQEDIVETLEKFDEDNAEKLERFDEDNAEILEKFDEDNVKSLEKFDDNNAEKLERFDEDNAEILEKFDEDNVKSLEKFDDNNAEKLERFDEDNAEILEKFDEDNVKSLEKFDDNNAEKLERFDEDNAEILEKFDEDNVKSLEKFDDNNAEKLERFDEDNAEILEKFDQEDIVETLDKFDEDNVEKLEKFDEDHAETLEKPVIKEVRIKIERNLQIELMIKNKYLTQRLQESDEDNAEKFEDSDENGDIFEPFEASSEDEYVPETSESEESDEDEYDDVKSNDIYFQCKRIYSGDESDLEENKHINENNPLEIKNKRIRIEGNEDVSEENQEELKLIANDSIDQQIYLNSSLIIKDVRIKIERNLHTELMIKDEYDTETFEEFNEIKAGILEESDASNNDFTHEHSLVRKTLRTEEKHFVCDVCDRLFLSKSSLLRHQRGHIGGSSYSCETGFG